MFVTGPKVVKSVTGEEVTDEELETVKNYLTGVFPLQLETANSVASRVINLKMYSLPKDYYSTYISAITKLTKQDILNAAKKYLQPENVYIVVSGDAAAITPTVGRQRELDRRNQQRDQRNGHDP